MQQSNFTTLVELILGSVLPLLTGTCITATNAGCEAAPGFPKEIGRTVEKVGTSIADQAIWEDITANIDGQVIEPGYEAYGGVKYIAGVKFTGFSGRVGLGASGVGTGVLTPEARAAILSVDFQDERDREWVLKLLGIIPDPAPTTQPVGVQ